MSDFELANRTYLYDIWRCERGQFIRRIRKLGRKRGISVEVVTSRGKGSHVTLLFGSRFTTVPGHRGDLPKGTLAAMLKELGLALSDLG